MNYKSLIGSICKSSSLTTIRNLSERNLKDINLLLSRRDKFLVGLYLILNDYAEGRFPPTFVDQQKAYDGENNYIYSLPGVTANKALDSLMQKPFWFGNLGRKYLADFIRLMGVLEKLSIHPPKRLLELGCGTGWMAEFLSLMNFEVVATSISGVEIERARTRINSISIKGINPHLIFMEAKMESINHAVQGMDQFDAIYVYEALHHAYDWRKSIVSSFDCVKPGGWLLLCNEPGFLHTYISYRIGRISNTHEIGFRRSEIVKHLITTGFYKVINLGNIIDLGIRPHWIAAQKRGGQLNSILIDKKISK